MDNATCMIEVFPTPGAPSSTTLSSFPSDPLPPFSDPDPDPLDGMMVEGLGSCIGLSWFVVTCHSVRDLVPEKSVTRRKQTISKLVRHQMA